MLTTTTREKYEKCPRTAAICPITSANRINSHFEINIANKFETGQNIYRPLTIFFKILINVYAADMQNGQQSVTEIALKRKVAMTDGKD
ncbi:hypothetical protein GWI33_021266 [Rhynchophorus ferrugineus]|uniref:Uncharacterized protein n=1 Tax=Rhynchophorus ferrugineus TaxID=354439 RepID=A0A834I1K1_RHYFE|nr:hypothetical protein GWI33_021266 [Rhynchophorus ferrugineus]